jgi:hypothetical protein
MSVAVSFDISASLCPARAISAGRGLVVYARLSERARKIVSIGRVGHCPCRMRQGRTLAKVTARADADVAKATQRTRSLQLRRKARGTAVVVSRVGYGTKLEARLLTGL